MALDAKKLAAAIVAKSKDEGAEESAPSFYEVAAGNIISAVKTGDAKALASSLREFSSLESDAGDS